MYALYERQMCVCVQLMRAQRWNRSIWKRAYYSEEEALLKQFFIGSTNYIQTQKTRRPKQYSINSWWFWRPLQSNKKWTLFNQHINLPAPRPLPVWNFSCIFIVRSTIIRVSNSFVRTTSVTCLFSLFYLLLITQYKLAVQCNIQLNENTILVIFIGASTIRTFLAHIHCTKLNLQCVD